MRSRLALNIAVLLAFSISLGACLAEAPDHPRKLDLAGAIVEVWDLSQPHMEGATDYRMTVDRVVDEFRKRTGATVNLRFAGRQEVMDLLSGTWTGDVPDLVCSGEWPVLPSGLKGLSGWVDEKAYADPAASYWQADGELWAIPSYMHWTASARREQGTGGVYIWDSPVFLTAALGSVGTSWEPDMVFSYLEWVRDGWGKADKDPLGAWEYGEAGAIYPVTPYLWRYLSGKDSSLRLEPVPAPSGIGEYFYTVPAYIVLAEAGATRDCAAELGKELASNLGRWAARYLGCVPALRDDLSLWSIEGGFSYEQRAAILESFHSQSLVALAATSYLEGKAQEETVRKVAEGYLCGVTSKEDTLTGIREALRRNTSP